jgi:predicted NAD-dependent protein-ADP-ribosyltransferase YbiA (DUF1768 family)
MYDQLENTFNGAVDAGKFSNLYANPCNSGCLFLAKDHYAVASNIRVSSNPCFSNKILNSSAFFFILNKTV